MMEKAQGGCQVVSVSWEVGEEGDGEVHNMLLHPCISVRWSGAGF